MKRHFIPIIIIIILLSTINIVTSLEIQNILYKTNNNTIYVDDSNINGPWDGSLEYPYKTINDGIYNSTDGDTIYVFKGMYNESIVIDKWITLEGEKKNETIIDGMYHEFVILFKENNINLKNFTIKNSGGYKDNAGIKVNSNKNIISDCSIYRTKTGLYINEFDHNEVTNCTIHTNGEGIFLKSSDFNVIADCYFTHNAIGINIQISERNLISNCFLHTNGLGIYINSSSNNEFIHCAISDNNDNQGGIFFTGCTNLDFINCNILHNGIGLKISNSRGINIKNCNIIWNTHCGIRANDSQNIVVKNCEIANNFRYAIKSVDGNCKIIYNNIYENYVYGIKPQSSFCDARYNWWGFISGPAYTSFGLADRIARFGGKIRYFPWLLKYQPNAGTDWEIDDLFSTIELPDDIHKTIEIPGLDTDNDGAPDSWEIKWGYNPNVWDDHINLDPDEDALNNLEECYTDDFGSSPFHKDIFLEFDWTNTSEEGENNKPPSDQIELMRSAFEKNDITLHIDDGNLGGGEEIPSKPYFTYDEIRDIYWNYFLHNNLDNQRKGIFHYGFICDRGPAGGFSIVGWDHLDYFGISGSLLKEGFPRYDRGRLITTASMHETGHTLGLFVDDFGGIDNLESGYPFDINFWRFRNYKSCMSYRYTWDIMDYSDGTHGKVDFDDWDNLDLSFFKNSHFEWPKEPV